MSALCQGIALSLVLLVSTICLAEDPNRFVGEEQEQNDYADVKDFPQAVKRLRDKLSESNSPYLEQISEARVRKGILHSIRAVELQYEKGMREPSNEATRRAVERNALHFSRDIKPILLELLTEKTWPAKAFFLRSESLPSMPIQIYLPTKPWELMPGSKMVTHGYVLPVLRFEVNDGPPDVNYLFSSSPAEPKPEPAIDTRD
jgi:hypothetical protein